MNNLLEAPGDRAAPSPTRSRTNPSTHILVVDGDVVIRDLEAEVSAGRFREDLYYRLNMVELRVPALRCRIDDIPELIEFFSARFSKKYQRPLWRPDAETLRDVVG